MQRVWLLAFAFAFAFIGCTGETSTTAMVNDEETASSGSTTPSPSETSTDGTGPIPGLTADSLYGVYYGDWNDALLHEVTGATGTRRYDLVIVHPNTNITPPMVAQLRAAGVRVFCYLTIGEDDTLHTSAASAGVAGPGGYASWYYDANGDQQPDQNGIWNSYYANPADPHWREALRTYRNMGNEQWYGYDYLIHDLHCDGVFLDTVDTVYPADWGGPYAAQLGAMVDLIEEIRAKIPDDRYLIINRGLFYFDPYDAATNPAGLVEITTDLRDRLRRVVNGVMFENFTDDSASERTYWGSRVDTEGDKTDGFTILSLDYVENPAKATPNEIQSICAATRTIYGWLPHISTVALDQFVHLARDGCY